MPENLFGEREGLLMDCVAEMGESAQLGTVLRAEDHIMGLYMLGESTYHEELSAALRSRASISSRLRH